MDLKAIWEMSVKKNPLGNDARIILISATLVFFLAFGIGVSFWGGAQLKASAHEVWLVKGKDDAARLTETVLFWVSKAKVNMRAIAGQFRGRNTLDADSFLDLVEDAGTWDPDVTFGDVAYVQRVLREDRPAFEASQGKPLAVVGRPREKAPESFESFAVRLSSRAEGVLRLNADLLTHPAMSETIITARQASGEVILGPAFKDEDGNWSVFLATAVDLSTSAGIMAATINLEDLFSNLLTEYLPPEMQIRVVKLDGSGGGEPVFIPIIGSLEPPEGIAATETIKISSGLARWNLHWDILPGYLGGPAEAAAGFVRFGGSALTVLLAAVFGFLSFQNVRFHRLVQERTAELARNAMIIQLTMDTIDQGFVVWNSDQRLVVWSKACIEFWYEPENLRHGIHMKDLLVHIARKGVFGEGDPEKLAAAELKRISGAGTDSEETFILIDGRNIHVRRFPLEKGGHVGVYTDITAQEEAINELKQARDEMERQVRERTRELSDEITERKQAGVALRESERRFRDMAESASDWFWEMGPDLRFTYHSERYFEITGFRPEDKISTTRTRYADPSDLELNADKWDQHFADLEAHKPFRNFEYSFKAADGGILYSRTSGTPIFAQDGAFLGYRGTGMDITQRVEDERRLTQAEKMESLGGLAGGIAHDFNNMLLPILSLTDMTRKSLPEDSRERLRLDKVVEAATRAKDLVARILAFSHQEDAVRQNIDIYAAIDETMGLLRSTLPMTIKIKQRLKRDTGTVFADRAQIASVLLNLASNAADAMDGKTGQLKVSLSPVKVSKKKAASIPGLHEGKFAKLAVKDQGHGMDEETLARVMEPFFTTKPIGEGTGLGLSMVHGIVSKHGGVIDISSTPGKGTTVEVYLPLVEGGADHESRDDDDLSGGVRKTAGSSYQPETAMEKQACKQ